jgi:hypothetical protein
MIFDPCKSCLVRAACSLPCEQLINRLKKNEKISKKLEVGLQAIYRVCIVILLIGLFLFGMWGAFIHGAR